MTAVNAEIRIEALPTLLQRVVRAVGIEPAERLLAKRGGTRLKFPRTVESRQRLEKILGASQAVDSLLEEFQERDYLDLPTSKKLEAQRRNAEIRSRAKDGATVPELAVEYRMSAAYIRMILSAEV